MCSRVLNNRRGWNNTGGGGLDIIIIINNKGVGIIGGLDGVQKIVQAVSQYLYVKLNTALFSFFSTNVHIFPIRFNTRKLKNDGF